MAKNIRIIPDSGSVYFIGDTGTEANSIQIAVNNTSNNVKIYDGQTGQVFLFFDKTNLRTEFSSSMNLYSTSSNPPASVGGIYYNTIDGNIYKSNGSSWVTNPAGSSGTSGTSGVGGYLKMTELLANKQAVTGSSTPNSFVPDWTCSYTSISGSTLMFNGSFSAYSTLANNIAYFTLNIDNVDVATTSFTFNNTNFHCVVPCLFNVEQLSAGSHTIKLKIPTGIIVDSSDFMNLSVVESMSSGINGTSGTSGATGAPGPQGAKGVAGAKGATGSIGVKGDKGNTGASGASGSSGTSGATGAPGPQGAKGVAGAKGATGGVGAKGDKGNKGEPGTSGTSGIQGIPGPQGSKGATGAKGNIGSQGVKGDKGNTGAPGGQGGAGTSGTSGTSGVKGQQGAPGPQGAKGNTGAKGGVGGIGVKGDKGNKGEAGTSGSSGTSGSKGNIGSPGPKGFTGAPGSPGTKGGKGDKGNTGTGTKGQKGETGSNAGITSFTNGADNRVVTATSSTGLNAEANLTFDGTNLYCSGDIIAYYSSDARLKDNIRPLNNALERVLQLNGVKWDWNDNTAPAIKDNVPNVGLIAQEVQLIMPEVVTERPDGYLALDYTKLVGLLVEAIKELANK